MPSSGSQLFTGWLPTSVLTHSYRKAGEEMKATEIRSASMNAVCDPRVPAIAKHYYRIIASMAIKLIEIEQKQRKVKA